MPQKLIFVSGCARSGTTVVATILNWSDSVFVAQERYAPRVRHWPDTFKPELYSLPRLLQFEAGECGYPSFESKGEYSSFYANPKDFAALEGYAYLGDKITHLFRRFDSFARPEWAETQVTLVHVVRNIADVAASYQTRMLDAGDPWNWDHLQAITDWTDAVNSAHHLYTHPLPNVRFGVVDYDSLFGGDLAQMVATVRRVYAFIGLDFGQKQLEGMKQVFRAGEEFTSKRQSHANVLEDVRALVAEDTMHKQRQLADWCL